MTPQPTEQASQSTEVDEFEAERDALMDEVRKSEAVVLPDAEVITNADRAALMVALNDMSRDNSATPLVEAVEAIIASHLRSFVDYVASSGAYNGADDPGQRFYDWGLNPWLDDLLDRHLEPVTPPGAPS